MPTRRPVSRRALTLLCLWAGAALAALAQPALQAIRQNRNIAASNYCVYPDQAIRQQTPPPAGKRPFHISHYGRHGSRYLSNRKAYDIPFYALSRADSLGKLTDAGREVLRQVALVRQDAVGRWGDLTPLGSEQHRGIIRRMAERFPEVFEGQQRVDARSTTKIRCILSMGAAVQQLCALHPGLKVRMDASEHDMWYMNFQDRLLRDSMMTSAARKAYDHFAGQREHNERLMGMLFNDTAYVRDSVDDGTLNYYLFKVASIVQNTPLRDSVRLASIFTDEEVYRIWQKENAWWYITYGPSLLNGGREPYTQRHLLRRIIHEADSCLRLPQPGAQLRYGHETMVLPLACLLDLNGFGFQTLDLEEVERSGWFAFLVFPMAANLQFVFYRESPADDDVLVKVLLNENEATLPLKSDVAPYYHWSDFRSYYLRLLDAYDAERSALGLEG